MLGFSVAMQWKEVDSTKKDENKRQWINIKEDKKCGLIFS